MHNTQLNIELEAKFKSELLEELGEESNFESHRMISAFENAKLAALEQVSDFLDFSNCIFLNKFNNSIFWISSTIIEQVMTKSRPIIEKSWKYRWKLS